MDRNELDTIAQALKQEWGLMLTDVISEQEIIDKLALRIAVIAEKGPDVFFQLMYRLDIPEKLLVNAMHNKEAALEIAKLVYNRQRQKIDSRAYYRNKKEQGDEDLGW